mmetsp:Transcript_18739/g.33603  ORF Transcript_18739/g.33603 Transcript_18739/m.33603 type:complete len:895 (+) Transcript_18739:430-3114(+)
MTQKMEIDPEITPRQRSRRKSSDSPLTFQSKGTKTKLRPDVDVILSLKDLVYKTVMMGYFQRLGGKKNNDGNDAEKEVAREVLHLFKNRKRGERTRFFKPESRYSSKSYHEVDEGLALEKITADIYRRMESAKRWMKPENTVDDDGSTQNSHPPQDPGTSQQNNGIPTFDHETGKMLTASDDMGDGSVRPPPYVPIQQTTSASTKPNTPKSVKKNKKRKLIKKVPQSLPFLSNTIVAEVIYEEELRAKKAADGSRAQPPDDHVLQLEEVVNFFRGLYVHGWGEWNKVSKMVKTQSNENLKTYAMELEKNSPEVKKFFSSKQVHKMQGKHGVNVKRYGGRGAKPSGSNVKRTVIPRDDPAIIAASVMGAMRYSAVPKKPTKPKVVICLGDHFIDTEAEPSLVQLSSNQKRPADTLPDYFDPSVRPSVPTNSQQIYIPGNKVYARWLNKDDPGSYGTWYPGLVNASKIAPIQDGYNLTGIPSLLYHVKFDDGAESLDLDTEDIMMQDQYQVWLKDLEQYYSLPVTKEMTWKRLTKNTRVFAKWTDPTDPELHGSWMAGKVCSSRTWEDDENQWRYGYHICFDNGDQDEDLLGEDVVEEETYYTLIREKMERGRKKSRLSGFDLIAEASKISSPIPVKEPALRAVCGTVTNVTSAIADDLVKKKLYSKHSDSSDDVSLLAELRCDEVLESRPPSPTHVARLSSTPSPDVHYGIYMKAKPWQVDYSLVRNASHVPQGQSKPFIFANSNGPPQERDLNGTEPIKTHQESLTNISVSRAQCAGTKLAVSINETKFPDQDTIMSSKTPVEPDTSPTLRDNETKMLMGNATSGPPGADNSETIATNEPTTTEKSSTPAAARDLLNGAMPGATTQSVVAQELTNSSNPIKDALADILDKVVGE